MLLSRQELCIEKSPFTGLTVTEAHGTVSVEKKQQDQLDNNNPGFSLQNSSPLPKQLKEATSQMRKANLGSERKDSLVFIKVRGSHGNLVTALILSNLFQDTQPFFSYSI